MDNFIKFPPRQKAAAFNLDEVMVTLQEASGGGAH
jgi:arylsulfatase